MALHVEAGGGPKEGGPTTVREVLAIHRSRRPDRACLSRILMTTLVAGRSMPPPSRGAFERSGSGD
jgi:hypothetical protein